MEHYYIVWKIDATQFNTGGRGRTDHLTSVNQQASRRIAAAGADLTLEDAWMTIVAPKQVCLACHIFPPAERGRSPNIHASHLSHSNPSSGSGQVTSGALFLFKRGGSEGRLLSYFNSEQCG